MQRKEYAQKIMALIDHTRLQEADNAADVSHFCEGSITPFGSCAAICVYPEFLRAVPSTVKSAVNVATVINFPWGDQSQKTCLSQIDHAKAEGANEFDIVLPKTRDWSLLATLIKAARPYPVKIILETGDIETEQEIQALTEQCIALGADFIKTSTGKTSHGASPLAAQAILKGIKACRTETGIKISGGVRTLDDAIIYIDLIANALGMDAITPKRCRIGSSGLLARIQQELSNA